MTNDDRVETARMAQNAFAAMRKGLDMRMAGCGECNRPHPMNHPQYRAGVQIEKVEREIQKVIERLLEIGL